MITEDKVTTSLANGLLQSGVTKLEMSVQLGISRTTLDTRLDKHNWKTLEKKELRKF